MPDPRAGGQDLPFVLPERYTVVASLVGGAQGQLVKLQDTKMRRPVALKVIATAGDELVRRRFRHEVAALLELSGHPHVVTLYDFEEDPEHLLLFFEFCDGGSLARRQGQSPLDWPAVLRVGKEVAGALAAAHARGIVHRDVKPDNLLRCHDAVKVADFGLAAWTGAEAASYSRVGTDRYSAPEVLAGRGATAASDVYSLALTMLDLAGVTSEQLRAAGDPDRTRTRADLPGWADLAPVHELLTQMLGTAPAERPDAATVAQRLFTAERRHTNDAGVPITQWPPQGRTKPGPDEADHLAETRVDPNPKPRLGWRRLRRGWLLLAASLIAVAVVSGVLVAVDLTGNPTHSPSPAKGTRSGTSREPSFAGGVLTALPDRGEPNSYLIGNADHVVTVNTTTGHVVRRFAAGPPLVVADPRRHRVFFDASPSGSPFSLPGAIRALDVRTGRLTAASPHLEVALHAAVFGVAFSADGMELALENTGMEMASTTEIVKVAGGARRRWTNQDSIYISAMAWSPDGRALILGTDRGLGYLPVDGSNTDINSASFAQVDSGCAPTKLTPIPGTTQMLDMETCSRGIDLAYVDVRSWHVERRVKIAETGASVSGLDVDASGHYVIGGRDSLPPPGPAPNPLAIFIVRGNRAVVIGQANALYGWT